MWNGGWHVLTFISGEWWLYVVVYRGSGQIHINCSSCIISRCFRVHRLIIWCSYCCRHRRITSTLFRRPNLHLRVWNAAAHKQMNFNWVSVSLATLGLLFLLLLLQFSPENQKYFFVLAAMWFYRKIYTTNKFRLGEYHKQWQCCKFTLKWTFPLLAVQSRLRKENSTFILR